MRLPCLWMLFAVVATLAELSWQLQAGKKDVYLRLLLAMREKDPEVQDILDQWEEFENYELEVCSGDVEAEKDWPAVDLKLGQVGGVAVDMAGYPVVFHRGDMVWTAESFYPNNTFIGKEDGPIKEPTLLLLDALDGTQLYAWGSNKFFMPHGLTIDEAGNYWLTDVALHQVFKFAPGASEASLTLGQAFEPAQDNSDYERFCKPTDVAVASNGDIYVADGYCASRVMRFDKTGTFVEVIGEGDFWIPHSLALAEELDLLCVADRENMSIACYDIGAEKRGQLVRRYSDPNLGRVFAISYVPRVGLLYGVTGPTNDLDPQGFTLTLAHADQCQADFLDAWSPRDQGLYQPHDLAVSPGGEAIYVGEIGPNNLWKFDRS